MHKMIPEYYIAFLIEPELIEAHAQSYQNTHIIYFMYKRHRNIISKLFMLSLICRLQVSRIQTLEPQGNVSNAFKVFYYILSLNEITVQSTIA